MVIEELADRHVRLAASEWHGGQWSPLYALASSGAIVDGCAAELAECIRAAKKVEPADVPTLVAVAAYVDRCGLRGPQQGWSDLGGD